MADRILFIGWGATVRGREERGLEVFNQAVGFYGRCQQEGRIEIIKEHRVEFGSLLHEAYSQMIWRPL